MSEDVQATAVAENESASASDTVAAPRATPTISWQRGLGFRAIVGVLIVAILLVAGTWGVLETRGKTLVRQETGRLIEQMGNNAVSGLLVRANEIAALSLSVATVSGKLPKTIETFQDTLPAILDFGGDQAVAGGGYWPEPFVFDPAVERRSFFWGRNAQNVFEYYDDYNQPGPGYHHEEWYVPARYVAAGGCYWSQSYMDPYSYQPMVTCTTPRREGDQFVGVSTIDLRLEGLAAFAESWRQKTGGYVFIVDRNNKFITYPQPDKVKKIGKDDKGKRTEEFISAKDFAAAEPLFAPLADALTALNDETIAAAATKLGPRLDEIAKAIDEGSYQIDADQARLVAATTADPLRDRFSIERSTLYRSFEMTSDPELRKRTLAFVFHVPETYWKLVVVKPFDEATAVADDISKTLILYLVLFALGVVGAAYLLLNRFVISPLARSAKVMQKVGDLIEHKRYTELPDNHIKVGSRDEIGVLGHSFNELIDRVVANEGQLAQVNVILEQRVKERTAELSKALSELKSSQLQLIQSEKMASLGQMVAGVAHEINTPLGYVQNNVLMAQGFVTQLAELAANAAELNDLVNRPDANENAIGAKLAQVGDQAKRLRDMGLQDDLRTLFEDTAYGIEQIAEMVINLRNFSRLDEAKVKDTQIHECLESTLNIARNVLKNKVDVVKNYGEIPTIQCSPSQINQVFLNLINNAAQAIDGQGQLRISTTSDDDYVHVSIQDNGRGIPPEVLPRIFDPFFTTKKVGEGTGLGLSIAYKIIQQHNGRIRVSSKPGVGTRFVISLPRRELKVS